MQIIGIEGMSPRDLNEELDRGGRFVIYQYCISLILITFRRSSDIYFLKGGESGFSRGMEYNLMSFLLGWWGIPWGPIYTVGSLINNFKGGKNVTQEVIQSLSQSAGIS